MSRLRLTLAFTGVVLRRLAHDRSALFFMLVLPVGVIVIVGSTFGGTQQVNIGVVDRSGGPVSGSIVATLDRSDGVKLRTYDDAEELDAGVRRRGVDAGLVLPADLDARIGGTEPSTLVFTALPDNAASATARTVVDGALAAVGTPIEAATFARSAGAGGSFDQVLTVARRMEGASGATVEKVDVGPGRKAALSSFALTVPQNLVLFVFITGLASGSALIRLRNLGVLRRSMAMPVSARQAVLGVGLGWFATSLLQSLIIVVIGAVVFGVDWGDPLAATALVLVYSLVGAGAGLVIGVVGRDEDRTGAITPIVGIVLGALGGCMVPLEVFPDTMTTVAHVVPHYWAMVAWQKVVFDGAGIGSIVPSLAVLGGLGAVCVVVAGASLRRDLVGA
ncbi:MAG: ABC transporter permease [Acidimicrobiia bacterium]|nr:ABC transporter permease [Acidimicrobiia bacterium]